MNTMNNMQSNASQSDQPRPFRPKLTYFHANAKGTGAAVAFELHPAHDDTDGSVFATLVRQKTIGGFANGVRTYSTFDWENGVTVKLGIDDLSEMLMVFRGAQENVNDGRGLVHQSMKGLTVIVLEHKIEPFAGYRLAVSRKPPTGGEGQYVSVFLKPTEALGLSLALESALGVVAFGIPRVIPRLTGYASAGAQPPRNPASPNAVIPPPRAVAPAPVPEMPAAALAATGTDDEQPF